MSGCIEKKAAEGLKKNKGDCVKAVENALKEVFTDHKKACAEEKPAEPPAEKDKKPESPDKDKKPESADKDKKPAKKPLCPGLKKEC